jgi:hypothetical protein
MSQKSSLRDIYLYLHQGSLKFNYVKIIADDETINRFTTLLVTLELLLSEAGADFLNLFFVVVVVWGADF